MNWPFQHINFHLHVCISIFTWIFAYLLPSSPVCLVPPWPTLPYGSTCLTCCTCAPIHSLFRCSNISSTYPCQGSTKATTKLQATTKLLFPADDFNDNMLHPCASIHSKCFWEPFFRATCGLHHVCFHFHNCIFAHFTAFIQMCAFVQGSNYFHLWFPPSW